MARYKEIDQVTGNSNFMEYLDILVHTLLHDRILQYPFLLGLEKGKIEL